MKKFKLQKKWRFWRAFKKYNFSKRKKKIFLKLKNFFFIQNIIKKQFISFYGIKRFSRMFFKKNQCLFNFDFNFFKILCFLELKLNILSFRLFNFTNILEVNKFILDGFIIVNNKNFKKNYLVVVNDILQQIFKKKVWYLINFKCKKKIGWRKFNWFKWKKSKRKNFISFFWCIKKHLIVNYVEFNYKVLTGIIIMYPTIGEILLLNKKRNYSKVLLSKLYLIL